MVVKADIAVQGLLQVQGRVEVMGLQDVADAPIEPLHHPVGLRGSGFGQAMLDAQGLTQLVKFVFPGWLAVFGAEQPVSELLGPVGQQFRDLDGTGLGERLQESTRGGRGLVGLDGDEYPAGGAVNGHEEIPRVSSPICGRYLTSRCR